MRVIQQGQYIKESYAACHHCGTELAYYPADLSKRHIGKFVFKYFKCPICGEPNVVEKISDEDYK